MLELIVVVVGVTPKSLALLGLCFFKELLSTSDNTNSKQQCVKSLDISLASNKTRYSKPCKNTQNVYFLFLFVFQYSTVDHKVKQHTNPYKQYDHIYHINSLQKKRIPQKVDAL